MGKSKRSEAPPSPPASAETIHWSADMDGDGVVIQAEVVTPPFGYAHVRLTFNSGSQVTAVELHHLHMGDFTDLMGEASEHLKQHLDPRRSR